MTVSLERKFDGLPKVYFKTSGVLKFEDEMDLTIEESFDYLGYKNLLNNILFVDPYDIIFIAKYFIVEDFIKGLRRIVK